MLSNLASDLSFPTTLQNNPVVLAYYWAPWCAPCKVMSPLIEGVGNAVSIHVMKVNIDDFPTVAQREGVRGAPTLILYRNGVAVSSHNGSLSASGLRSWLKNNGVEV